MQPIKSSKRQAITRLARCPQAAQHVVRMQVDVPAQRPQRQANPEERIPPAPRVHVQQVQALRGRTGLFVAGF